MGPAASLAREKGDGIGCGLRGQGALCGCGRIREMSDAQKALGGPSGGLLSSLGVVTPWGGWPCGQELGGLNPPALFATI